MSFEDGPSLCAYAFRLLHHIIAHYVVMFRTKLLVFINLGLSV